MDGLNEILAQSTAAIAAEYFRLPIFGGTPRYRERVYCYELYHQMRTRWPPPDQSPYRLNGEVDKQGHAAMQALGIKGEKPDLIVHGPGDMGLNNTVIEIKPAPSKAKDIRKDLKTLSAFRAAGYARGIYLLYGERADDRMVTRIKNLAQTIPGAAGVEIWLHANVGQEASIDSTIE